MLPSPRADRARAQTAEADAHSKEAAEQRIADLERELEERNTRAEMLKEVVSDLTARLKNVKLAAADAHTHARQTEEKDREIAELTLQLGAREAESGSGFLRTNI